MRKRLSIYTRTLLIISLSILVIFFVLGFTYGTVYSLSADLQRKEELKRNAVELAWLTENRMDASHLTFTSTDITGHISFAARSTAAFVWVVNANGEIIYHTGIPTETISLLERSPDSDYGGDPLLPAHAQNALHTVYCESADKTGFAELLPDASRWLVASAPIGSHGDLYTGEIILVKRHLPQGLAAFFLEHNVPLSFFIAYILSLLIIIWLSRNITRPISQLAKTANSVYAGDLSARVRLGGDKQTLTLDEAEYEDVSSRSREDDLTRLVRTFNTLIAKFEEREGLHSEFLGNVSHDLRTPVTSIGGFISAMQDGTIPPEKFDYYLGIIKEETGRLEQLINDLFDDSVMEDSGVLKQEVFDLYGLIRQVKQSFEPMLSDKGISLELVFDRHFQDEVRVVADAAQLTRVLNNIIGNAVRYTPRKGIILVTTDIGDRSVTVCVEDNGPGIPAEDLPYIFDRFYKADKSRQGEGSGLGLYIARALVRRHGQQIDAGRSEDLGGARIRFTVARP